MIWDSNTAKGGDLTDSGVIKAECMSNKKQTEELHKPISKPKKTRKKT